MSPKRKPFEPDPSLAVIHQSGEEILEEAEQSRVQLLCQAHADEIVRALLEKCTGLKRVLEANEDGIFELEIGDDGKPVLLPVADGPAVAAGKTLLEQGFGRPTQRVDHTGDQARGGLTVVIQQISDGETKEINPALEAKVIEDRSTERVATS